MARRSVTVNGPYTNGNVSPPSTLAAQFVQNQTRPARSQPQRGTEATFPEILHTLLHSDTEQETDVNVNASLINVVTHGGLKKLLSENPFVDWDHLLDLAVESITLIEITFKRQPDALLVQLAPDEPQVFLSLLATLLAICGKPKCEHLPVKALLASAITALDASPDLWQYARTLREVIQDCVDDGLSALEALPTVDAPMNVTLPPVKSVAKLWPNSESCITMPQGSTTTVNDVVQIFAILLKLSQIPNLQYAWQQEAQYRLMLIAPRFKDQLYKAGSWQRLLEQLLGLTRSWQLAIFLLRDISNAAPIMAGQSALAKCLLHTLRVEPNAARDKILPLVRRVSRADSWDSLHDDLKIAIVTWLCRFEPPNELSPQASTLRDSLQDENTMTDSELLTAFKQLRVTHVCTGRRPWARKRREVPTVEPSDRRFEASEHSAGMLLGTRTADLTALPEIAPSIYATMEEDKQCAAWQALIDLAEHDILPTCRTVIRLIQALNHNDTKRTRVLSLLAVQACARRCYEAEYVSLATSDFGKYCLQHLSSSVRELRIASGQIISCFLREDLPENIRQANRTLALNVVRNISERDVANEQETLIIAWGQIAISSGDSELVLVLLQLLEYLGHGNMLIRALAFSEIENIAASKKRSSKELFQPFWRSVVISAVQDLFTKPQKTQEMCNLTGTDLNSLLESTQQLTLPHMVLTKRRDVLERIAVARGHGESVRDICLQPRTNLAVILAQLLVQPSADAEGYVMSCLIEADPAFKNIDLVALIKMDSGLVAAELLKHCGEDVDSKKSRAHHAFQLFANIAETVPGQRSHSSKSSRAIQSFLEGHILGILTHFSVVLEESGPAASNAEKTRCLKAISELFNLSRGNVSFALPQIRACLQAGLEQPALCETAFVAWLTLIPLLQAEDVANVVDETFVLVVRHWHALSPETQHKTHDMISQLVKKHNTILTENIMTLPSLKDVPLLSKFAAEFDRLKNQEGPESHYIAFTRRLHVDGDAVVLQALKELVPYLEEHQNFLHDTAASEHPSSVLSDLLCTLLDVTVKYSSFNPKAAELCGKALGLIGSVDPNRVEANRKKRQLLVLSNFDEASETIDWVLALFEDVLVKSFKSEANAREQGFLAYTIQELLHVCNFRELSAVRPRNSQTPDSYQRWHQLPEHVRTTLTPFLTSRYVVTGNNPPKEQHRTHQGFSPDASHGQWLRSFTIDLVYKAKGDNAKGIFPLLARAIKGHDLATARFVLPFAVLNVVVGGTVKEVQDITEEFHAVLTATSSTPSQQECVRTCSEAVFAVLDYLSAWLRGKRKTLADMREAAYKAGQSQNKFEEDRCMSQIDTIESFLASIPAEIIANQAVDCRSYARALFHWEQHIRSQRSLIPSGRLSDNDDIIYDRLQDIYSQIDEPDGLEGIAAHLPIITEDQQTFNHAKAGRWTAAQAWYELQLADRPNDVTLQQNVLRCLKETGQYPPLLRYANSFLEVANPSEGGEAAFVAHLPVAVEACWMTEDLDALQRQLAMRSPEELSDFNLGIGRTILQAANLADGSYLEEIVNIRRSITEGLSIAGTDSLSICHDEMLKLHILYELEALMTVADEKLPSLLHAFDKRLNAVGSYTQDKQLILGLRRAIMRLRPRQSHEGHAGALWLTTARLARQAKNMNSAYNAVLKAYDCGNRGAKLEEARLLWHEGHQRQAIRSLQAALDSGVFLHLEPDPDARMADVNFSVSVTTSVASAVNGHKQDMLTAKASLMLAKWLDASGQSQTKEMTDRYMVAARRYQRWEKGHYYLGKHYGKLLNVQKALPKTKQSQAYLTGEMTKLVIDNSLRSIPFGNKYWHETLPRVLTLWLELGAETCKKDSKEDQATFDKRAKQLQNANKQLQKYFERVPPYVFYHALPQIISRITHPHPDVWKQLSNILTKIGATHPSQALWSLLAIVKANDRVRVERGQEVLNRMKDPKNKQKGADASPADLRTMIHQGQRLCDGLLEASEATVDSRAVHVSLAKDLKFSHKLAPSQLVVPIAATLAASSPSGATAESIRHYKAFAHEKITIQAFTDDVLVLSSLQRPRKINARGSDGKLYGLLCKPKDDLRKDQRLMDFNGIINRALKRNTESSKRRLYIKTYAVTPLSEESGAIEWVEGIKPLRDILLGLYNRKGIRPNYTEIKKDLDVASKAEENGHIFAERVLSQFPACLHEWFTETYTEPDTWFAARLRYARSAAVMSMTGHILGLGDRHGENILLEEGTGGVFHVDFNCLFDKGLTFEKPEVVPFRLTHNMVDAMGPFGYEGPFRKSCELTLGLLRQERDTLMTVLETFLYDPTTDFVGSKKKRSTAGVPETPAEILEIVATKLKGLHRGETVPLSVEGCVDALIQEATSHFRLASMYIGWCSFL